MMTLYCMETGTERGGALVHKVSCGSFDLGTLMGNGDLCRLGDFASSEEALDEAHKCHEDAVCCVDCCIMDLISHERVKGAARTRKVEAKKNLYREVVNGATSIRDSHQCVFPESPSGKTSRAVELRKNEPTQFPVVILT